MSESINTKKLSDYFFVGVFTFLFGVVIGASTPFVKNFIGHYALAIQNKVLSIGHKGFYLPSSDFNLYWQVYKDLKSRYADKDKVENDKAMYYGSIKGMVASIGDPATMFLDPQETKEYNRSLSPEYEGIGAQLDNSPHGVFIVTVFDGSPAQKAGLQAQDIILKVNGKDVLGKTARELVGIIKGPAGTKVTLTVLRQVPKVQKLDITITRGHITIPSSRLVEVKDKIAVIRVSRFTDSTYAIWVANMHKIMQQVSYKIKNGQVKGIIIDLRGNPGGFLEAAVNFASYFLKPGSVVSYMQTRQGIVSEYKVSNVPTDSIIPGSVPIVILVDHSSASASEIFSGALQYYKRAVLVGTKTYGKGTVQRILDYSDGSTLHITIAHWLLPNKEKLTHAKPVSPDYNVELDYDAKINKGIDNQMQKASEILKKKFIK